MSVSRCNAGPATGAEGLPVGWTDHGPDQQRYTVSALLLAPDHRCCSAQAGPYSLLNSCRVVKVTSRWLPDCRGSGVSDPAHGTAWPVAECGHDSRRPRTILSHGEAFLS
jgi:hypothetical protein